MNTIERIIGMLTEEKENNMKRKENYEREMNDLPKGTIHIRKRNSCEYLYLFYYCDKTKKTKDKYIGTDKTIIPIIEEQIEKRKQIQEMLKILEEDLRTIESMLKIADKSVQPKVKSVRKKIKESSVNKKSSFQTLVTDVQNTQVITKNNIQSKL